MRIKTLSLALCLAAMPALAHNGVEHKTPEAAAKHQKEEPLPKGPSLPFDLKLGGEFALTDHTGVERTQADPDGQLQLLFFGYVNCQAICSVAFPLMAGVVNDLAALDVNVTPLMVTVDPKRDTLETIGPKLQTLHPDFVGLTGTQDELQKVYDLYSIEQTVVFTDPEYGDVYAHGSNIYLLNAEGKFLTLLPPILSAERIVEIVQRYKAL